MASAPPQPKVDIEVKAGETVVLDLRTGDGTARGTAAFAVQVVDADENPVSIGPLFLYDDLGHVFEVAVDAQGQGERRGLPDGQYTLTLSPFQLPVSLDADTATAGTTAETIARYVKSAVQTHASVTLACCAYTDTTTAGSSTQRESRAIERAQAAAAKVREALGDVRGNLTFATRVAPDAAAHGRVDFVLHIVPTV